jgi:hypothetical protein
MYSCSFDALSEPSEEMMLFSNASSRIPSLSPVSDQLKKVSTLEYSCLFQLGCVKTKVAMAIFALLCIGLVFLTSANLHTHVEFFFSCRC